MARPDPPASEVAGLLGSVSQKLGFLKRRSEGSIEEELECTRLCKARLEHLKKYVSSQYSCFKVVCSVLSFLVGVFPSQLIRRKE